ncbi:MAG: hypothetical protein JNK29_14355 [Anaerolineales bacterium]|nr:hypothetical protein [Anaerolineales bacterium]
MAFLFAVNTTALDRLWPAVEAWYGRLPPALFRLGVLLRHELAAAWSDTGQFADSLRRPPTCPPERSEWGTEPPAKGGPADLPWLSVSAELLPPEAPPALADALLLAMAAAGAAAHLRARCAARDPELDPDFEQLEAALLAEVEAQLARLLPPQAPAWDAYQRRRARHHQAGVPAEAWAAAAAPFTAERRRAADWAALLALPALAAGRPELESLLDDLALQHHTLRECLAVRADLRAGRPSYPLARLRLAARLPADAAPETVLGALVLSGVMGQIAAESGAELAEARRAALALGLPGLAGHCAALAEQFAALAAAFALRPGLADPGRPTPAFQPARDPLAEAVTMAAGYLLADRAFRESWEVQRRGLFGEAEVTGRVFGPGLILELLAEHHADLAADVDALLDRLAVDGYRYYPHRAVPPDSDDLGLALRLCRHAADPARQRAQLARPLGWLPLNQGADGHLPCWLTRGVEDLDTTAGAVLWGGRCQTVEANLLLGLLAFDPAGQAGLITRAGAAWLERWQAAGLGGNALYEPGYALWTALRLITALRGWAPLHAQAELALPSALERLAALAPAAGSAQLAACLTLACRGLGAPPEARRLFRPEWLTLLLARQRYDGGWPAEPLFVTPTRGEAAAWYASAAVTSALGWAALRAASRA